MTFGGDAVDYFFCRCITGCLVLGASLGVFGVGDGKREVCGVDRFGRFTFGSYYSTGLGYRYPNCA